MRKLAWAGAAAIAMGLVTGVTSSASAQSTCQNQPFAAWLAGVGKEAQAKGIPASVVDEALAGVSFDPAVVAKDRGQSVFSQSFLQFATRMVAPFRLSKGQAQIKRYATTFADIEARYGVPAPVIVAFWGLETDFGAVMGNLPTLHSVATLAYDCRRSDKFHEELLAALQIIARGDLEPAQMIGPWAGELGQFQFLPSYYVKYAVDEDGDGRRDLIHSTPDALASAGNYLQQEGWQRGQPWLQEVKVPADMPWDKADSAIQLPVSQWQQYGVTPVSGSFQGPTLQAALLLPMGRLGPAFLAYPNFFVFQKWNQSGVYSTTAAYFATRLAGAPTVGKGNGTPEVLGAADIKRLQLAMTKAGLDVGDADGKLGSATKAGIKQMQIKYGLPADSYPTTELIQKMGVP